MTNAYEPQQLSGYLPFLGGGPLDDTAQDPPAPLHYRTFKLPASDPDVAVYGPNGVIGWELKIDDLRGGYLQVGDFARGANPLDGDYRMTSSSTLDTRFRRHLILTTANYGQSTAPTMNGGPLWHATVFNTLYLARGNAANATLMREPASGFLVPMTYTPLGKCNGLFPIVIGGVSAAERIAFLATGATVDVLSIAGVSAGTMHANLATCWGLLTSPINASAPGTGTHLFYANNGIWALPLSAAIGAAPVQTLSNVPGGGYAIGVEKLPEGPLGLRAYWAWPLENRVTSVYADGNFQPAPHRLMSTNLEGTDPLPVPIPLTRVQYSCLWRRNLVAADVARIVVFDGDKSRDLHVLANRPLYSGTYRVLGLMVNDNDLFAIIGRVAQNSVADSVWIEQYLPQFDSWLQITRLITVSSSSVADGNPYDNGTFMVSFANVLPTSKKTGNCYFGDPSYSTFFTQWLAPSGQNPYYLYQYFDDASGSGTVGKQPFLIQGTWTGPYWELPNLEGRWKRADEIVFLGDVVNAATDCYVDVSLNGDPAVRFSRTLPHVAQVGATGTAGLFTQLRVAISLWQGITGPGSPWSTPNGLPLLIRGRAYLTDPDQFVLGVPTGP